MATAELNVSDMQFNGSIRFKALERAILATGNRKSDMELLKELEAAMTGTRQVSVDSVSTLVVGEAIDYLNGWFRLILSQPISTANVGLWVAARGVVPSVRCLMLVPDTYCGEQGLKKMLLTACWTLSLMGRLADEERVHEVEREIAADELTFKDMVKEALPIYLDIAAGRAGAWIGYIDYMGDAICKAYADGTSWQALINVAADARAVELRDNLVTILGVSPERSLGVMSGVMLTMAGYSEAHANEFRRRGGIGLDARDGVMDKLRAMSGAPDELYADVRSVDLRGYAAEFGVSEFASVFQLPPQFEANLRVQAQQQRANG